MKQLELFPEELIDIQLRIRCVFSRDEIDMEAHGPGFILRIRRLAYSRVRESFPILVPYLNQLGTVLTSIKLTEEEWKNWNDLEHWRR